MTDETFSKLQRAFPNDTWSTWKVTKARAEFLAAFKPVPYDCCINTCCCYVGPHAKLEQCPYCKEPRYRPNPDPDAPKRPRKRFTYVPLIPRLTAFYKSQSMIEKLRYRHVFNHEDGIIKDIMDGKHYARLRAQNVVVDGKQLLHKFFSDLRDIALGLSTDGFAPFRRRKKTCWPLLIYNYNLPPDIRFHLQYILCVGVIPGPNKPKDFDSFAWPLVEELLKLAVGVRAYDTSSQELFSLRAYLILVFGDIPAVSMVMRIKGHNGLVPCRMCKIKGLRPPGAKAPAHYVPHDRSRHPNVQDDPNAIKKYDVKTLPLRTHEEMMDQARKVQFAQNHTTSEALAKKYGVKGISLLSYLSSITFPISFPYDFMHLIFENVIKNLVLLWTGHFKDLDEGTGSYELNKGVWEAIGAATAASGSTIPLAFGARPNNVADDKQAGTADTWSFWLLYLGPVLLARKFENRAYYDHFIQFVKLIHICLQFEISKDDLKMLRSGFQEWVEKYEKCVLCHLSAAPVN